jgi:hypothetical protein
MICVPMIATPTTCHTPSFFLLENSFSVLREIKAFSTNNVDITSMERKD